MMNSITILIFTLLALQANGDGADDIAKEIMIKMAKHMCDGQPDVIKYMKDMHDCEANITDPVGKEIQEACFQQVMGFKMADNFEDTKKQLCSTANFTDKFSQLEECEDLKEKEKGYNSTESTAKTGQCVYGDLVSVGDVKIMLLTACLKMHPISEMMLDKGLKCDLQSTGAELEDRKKCFKEVFAKDLPEKWEDVKTQFCSAMDDAMKYQLCYNKAGERPERVANKEKDQKRSDECMKA